MTESQGIIRIENPEYRRRKFIRSFLAQSILQALTFGAAIVTYHLIAMPQLVDFARQDGWNRAVNRTCPSEIGKAGG